SFHQNPASAQRLCEAFKRHRLVHLHGSGIVNGDPGQMAAFELSEDRSIGAVGCRDDQLALAAAVAELAFGGRKEMAERGRLGLVDEDFNSRTSDTDLSSADHDPVGLRLLVEGK